MVLGALITAAFGSDDPPAPGVVVDWIFEWDDGRTPEPTRTTMPQPTGAPATPSGGSVSGFAYPLEDACLPEDDNLMPGAPREYRQAIHQGVDFYDSDNCAFVGFDTEVLAAKAGTVTRADWTYQELTRETLADLEERVEQEGGDAPAVADAFRGRQVWIEHGDGTGTRYAHLGGIAESVVVGSVVAQGETIAYVGESGTPESVTDPGTQIHLHFEIRVGEGYLGLGLSPDEVRDLYGRALSP